MDNISIPSTFLTLFSELNESFVYVILMSFRSKCNTLGKSSNIRNKKKFNAQYYMVTKYSDNNIIMMTMIMFIEMETSMVTYCFIFVFLNVEKGETTVVRTICY